MNEKIQFTGKTTTLKKGFSSPKNIKIVAEIEASVTAIDHFETEPDRQITRSNRLRNPL